MFHRGWHDFATVGGLTALALAFLTFAAWQSHQSRDERYPDADSRCSAEQLRRAKLEDQIRAAPTTDQTPKGEINGREPDWCDLAAQESMANSTFHLKWAGWLSLIASIGGLIMLGTTLHFTRVAADASRDGLREARRSADAAVQTANVERGVVFISPSFRWAPSNRAAEIGKAIGYATCSFTNYGRSPIVLRQFERDLMLQTQRNADPDNTQPHMPWIEFPGGRILQENISWSLEHELELPALTPEDMQTVTNGANIVWFYGCLTYEDVLGNLRYTRFRWKWEALTMRFIPHGGPPHNERT